MTEATSTELPRPASLPTRPWTWWLAGALGAVILLLLPLILVLAFLNRDADDVWLVAPPLLVLNALTNGGIGVLIATRRPGNALGWLCLATALLNQIAALALQWAVYGLVTEPGTTGAAGALWLGLFFSTAGFAPAITFLVLFFPSGHLVGRVAWGVALVAGLAAAFHLYSQITGNEAPPGFPALYAQTPNPFAVPGRFGHVIVGILILLLCDLVAVALLLVRFRRSRAEARQQYKWIVYVLALLIAIVFLDAFLRLNGSPLAAITKEVTGVVICLVPVAVGIAVLRYHLFAIDLIIRRTLVYAPLTAIIAGGCAAAIKLFETVFESATGGESIIVVLVTTLILGAAFTPIQQAMQATLDRRFKAPTSPAVALATVEQSDHLTAGILNAADLMQPFLEKSVTAYGARGGAISLFRAGRLETAHTYGDFAPAASPLSILIGGNQTPLGLLSLGPRRDGSAYEAEDRATLQQAADRVAHTITLFGAAVEPGGTLLASAPETHPV